MTDDTYTLPPLWYYEAADAKGRFQPRTQPDEPRTTTTDGTLRLDNGGHMPRVRRVCLLPDHLRSPQRALPDLQLAVPLWLGDGL